MLFSRKSNRFNVPTTVTDALGDTFSDHELSTLSKLGTIVSLDAGSLLMTEGRLGAEALVIIEGTAAVSRDEDVVATVGVGDIVGEIALLTGERRSASVVATTPMRAIVLNPREFASLVDQCPRLDREFRLLADTRAVA